MKLDVRVCGRTAASLYRECRECDEYVLRYLSDIDRVTAHSIVDNRGARIAGG